MDVENDVESVVVEGRLMCPREGCLPDKCQMDVKRKVGCDSLVNSNLPTSGHGMTKYGHMTAPEWPSTEARKQIPDRVVNPCQGQSLNDLSEVLCSTRSLFCRVAPLIFGVGPIFSPSIPRCTYAAV